MESRKHRLTRRPFLLTVLCALAIAIAPPCAAFADDTAEKTAQPTGETPASIAIDGSATNLVQSDEAATLGVTLGQNTPESGASSIALDNTPSTLAAAENSYIPLPVNALVVQSEHQAMLDKVNALRASQGVAPLTWNSNLTGAAMQRAIEIALRFSHTRPHGDLCYTANPEIFGENIAYALISKGNSSTDLIYEGWHSSSGHYANMVNGNYSSTALGHIKADVGLGMELHLWVQLFSFSNVPGSVPSSDGQRTFIVPLPPDAAKSVTANPSNLLLDAKGSYHPDIVIEYQESSTIKNSSDEHFFIPDGSMSWGHQIGVNLVGGFSTDNPNVVSYDPNTGLLLSGKEMGMANCTATLITAPELSANYTVTNSAFSRLAGDFSAETAALIAAQTMTDMGASTSKYAVIARNDDFADAMSATGLAGTLKAPILLTSNTGLSYAAQVALQELSVEKVYIVGGPGAVLPQVENDINALGVQTERVYGNYSWDTSVKCAEKIHALGGNPNGEVIVAMSTNFQDALSISPLAYRDSIPILLQGNGTTIPRELTADEKSLIATQTSGTIWVPGGPGAVPEATVEGEFPGREIVRMWGYDGYDTSLEIANTLTERGRASAECVVIASGAQGPKGVDALAGAALAGVNNGVILLVNANSDIEGVHTEAADEFLLNGPAGTAFMNAFRAGTAKGYMLGGSFVMPYGYEAWLSLNLGNK